MDRMEVESVDDYIAAQPAAARPVLNRVRGAIRKAVPAAEETISYRIPAYRLHGRAMLYFAGWKEHYSLYPSTAGVVAAFRDDLARYEVRKGTIRFPLSERVPVRLIQGIARLRAREVVEHAEAKASARGTRKAAAARVRSARRR